MGSNKKRFFVLVIFLLGLIVFDSFQQKYYLETFSLSEANDIDLHDLMFNHAFRWFVLLTLSIPACYHLRHALQSDTNSSIVFSLKTFLIFLFSLLFSISAISVFSLVSQNASVSELPGYLEFFFYQKGAVFSMAYLLIYLYCLGEFQALVIYDQSCEISNLYEEKTDLNQQIKLKGDVSMSLKSGNTITQVFVKDIIWIEADDYCVRVHTNSTFYSVRKSLKSLESDLSSQGFFRVHRKALINVAFLHDFSVDRATVKLDGNTEIQVSKKRIKSLSIYLKKGSILE